MLFQPCEPAGAGADGGGLVQQAVLFFPAGQAGELGMERVVGVEERFFAMQDRRVGAGGVIEAVELLPAKVIKVNVLMRLVHLRVL